MRLPGLYLDAVEFGDRIGTTGLVVRGILVLSVAVSSLTASALGGYQSWLVVGLVLLGCFAATTPDSLAPLVVITAMCVQWVVLVNPVSVTWSVVPALCVLAVHVTAARAASLADHAPYDTALMRRWAGQSGVVGIVTFLVWTVARVMSSTTRPTGVAVTALAFAAVGVATVVMVRRLDV